MGTPKNYIGERSRMRNGLYAEVISQNGCMDISVRFENGTIKDHVRHDDFLRGNVHSPMVYTDCGDYMTGYNPNTKWKHVFMFDASDFGKVAVAEFWYTNSNGYVLSSMAPERKLHRYLLDAPKGAMVDHKNGNPLDNRRYNIRICNHSDNVHNSKIPVTNTSGYKGVIWDKERNRWKAQISLRGKTHKLGRYKNKIDAACAYNMAAIKHFGEFARINQIPEEAENGY